VERDHMAGHMKGEFIELEAHIPLDSMHRENLIFYSFSYDLGQLGKWNI
jgi:hypothetical protein